MKLSKFYAKLIGLYLIIMSIGIGFKPQPFLDKISQEPVLLSLGFFGLLLGLAIVVSHQVWKGWPILITLIGFWGTIKGILILFFPPAMNAIMTALLKNHYLLYGLGFDFILGLILLYCGFKGYHSNKTSGND